jgi:ABC-2 type transport system permease protein
VLGLVRDIAGVGVAEATATFSVLDHFDSGRRGLIEARSLVFYGSFIAMWLAVTGLFVSARKGG